MLNHVMARETPATCNNYLRYVSKYGLSFSALPLPSSRIPEANKYPPIASIFAMSMVPMAPLAFLQKMPVVQRRVGERVLVRRDQRVACVLRAVDGEGVAGPRPSKKAAAACRLAPRNAFPEMIKVVCSSGSRNRRNGSCAAPSFQARPQRLPGRVFGRDVDRTGQTVSPIRRRAAHLS
ncbi:MULTISPECIES: hypothetical protein [unclassified Mesorhizobium]|uniref:hypothetical protein n=1 Tax=unclassified Mesorhizobium TaxID=325217 RepID=UPI0011410470|nr:MULTISPECIES: hypothetical protein [unclassified Mesorhizobium]MDG4901126.1 hypothetical protein [Mesorhizobium sp. WSM4962]MDG4916636.1 hypothetical protein [Mesorhizobium sp. WSM4989]